MSSPERKFVLFCCAAGRRGQGATSPVCWLMKERKNVKRKQASDAFRPLITSGLCRGNEARGCKLKVALMRGKT